MIAHNVYFALNDNSAAARQSLVDACQKYLSDHPGIVSFACGLRAADHVRAVNDLDFDVGLHIVFQDKAAHDQYQAAPLHLQFVEENKGNWKKARVFDTVLE
jgi:hypothetical protein